jgi:hypothetical protein
MRRIILDTNVILTNPSTGSFASPDNMFVVPVTVASELLAGPTGVSSSYSSLLGQMVNSGNTEVVSAGATTPTVPWSPEQPVLRLSHGDQAVLAVADEVKRSHPQDEVLIASDDRDIHDAGRRMGLKVLSSAELATLLHGTRQDPTVKEQANRVLAYERKHLVWSALCGATATAGMTLIVQNIEAILATAHVWVTILILPLAGITLFWVRSRQRLGYGITEFGVGLVAALSIFLPSFRLPEVGVSVLVQLLGGLYIMVRGLDNIGVGLRGTAWGVRWQRWFREQ